MGYRGTESPSTWGAKHWTKRRPELVARGERAGVAKLTDAIVLAMREARANGASYDDIAIAVGVSRVTATRAIRGHSWKHLPPRPVPDTGQAKVPRRT